MEGGWKLAWRTSGERFARRKKRLSEGPRGKKESRKTNRGVGRVSVWVCMCEKSFFFFFP